VCLTTEGSRNQHRAGRPRIYWGYFFLWAAIFIFSVAAVVAPLRNWFGIGDAITKTPHIGDNLTTSGIVLAFLGFSITFVQLWTTKRSADAATEAVFDLTFRLRAFEDHELCRECRALCDEIERLHNLVMQSPQHQPLIGAYLLLPERYKALRVALAELRTRLDPELTIEQKTTMQSVIVKLSGTGTHISTRSGTGPSAQKPNLRPLQQDIQEMTSLLIELSVRLDSRVIGESDE